MNAPRTRVQRRPVHGVLLLDKPLGFSSNDALQKVKWLLRAEKAGHTGTLDPLATGVLPLCFGAATKFSQLQLDAPKTYKAIVQLGTTTTTGDAEGEVLAQCAVTPEMLTPERLAQVQAQFTGAIAQVPPMYSALKKDGKALYEYARAGVEVERAARDVQIHALQVENMANVAPALDWQAQPAIKITVTCSKGTYIRTLAEDIAREAGSLAHLTDLRRTATAGFGIAQSHDIETIEHLELDGRDALLLPCEVLVAHLPAITLEDAEIVRLRYGQQVQSSVNYGIISALRVYDVNQTFIGLVEALPEMRLKALRLMSTN